MMRKIRVYELARKLHLSSNELLDILSGLGLELTSHMNTVEDEMADLVMEMIQDEKDKDEPAKHLQKKEEVEEKKERIEVQVPIVVKELATLFQVPVNTFIGGLIKMNLMVSINQELDGEMVQKIAEKMRMQVQIKHEEKKEDEKEEDRRRYVFGEDDDPADLKPRPAVVTIMGHVDHGKTSLLDKIRETNVIAQEAGGITQHIGAYQVKVNDRKITFLDTPGHEAFTTMRARGAQVTDIAVLVVAADDGVMPQTIEAINHARAAKVPIIVAINKIDKNNANQDQVKKELSEEGLLPEDWGGETICVPISAFKGENLDDLLEMILLVSEMEEFKANPNRRAQGIVIEALLDRGQGPVATVLVKNGTLHIGEAMVAGDTCGRVRAMVNEWGEPLSKAPPGTPVKVLGFAEVPQAGDVFEVVKDDREARSLAAQRKNKKREEMRYRTSAVTLDDLYRQIEMGEVRDLRIILKGDVRGSVEALREALLKLSTDEVQISVVHLGVGAITETDVNLASASSAIIIGFNVRPDVNARKLSEREKVDIRSYRIIYQAIEDVKAALEGLLEPDYQEAIIGSLDIRATFSVPDIGIVAGCYVKEGKINRHARLRLIRDGVVIHEGDVSSLRRFKDDVREVSEGYECGVGITNYHDIKVGDRIEVFEIREIKRTL